MLFVMPALLVLFDRGKWLLLIKRSEEHAKVREARRFRYSGLIIGEGVIATILFIYPLRKLQLEYAFNAVDTVIEDYESFREFGSGDDDSTLHNPTDILCN